MIYNLIALCLVSFLLSALFTGMLIPALVKMNIVDKPSKRRTHKSITPRGGGIVLAIIYSTLIPTFEYYVIGKFVYSQVILCIFFPVAFVSLWEDLVGVNIVIRLIVHIFVSILAIMWMIHPNQILYDQLPMIVDLAIGSFALLTFLNIYNFMDGLDGLSVSESLHLSSTLLILCYLSSDIIDNTGFLVPTLLIIFGWGVGFALHNKPPARIFLGDVGSISLGFLLGLCLLMVASASAHLFLACVIASLYYIADGGLTLLIRIANKEKIWQPHLKHFFQRAVRRGVNSRTVVLKIIKCNFLLMLFSIISLYYPIISVIASIMVVTYTLLRLTSASLE